MFTLPALSDLLTQGDLLDDCPLVSLSGDGVPADPRSAAVERRLARVIVLTQACDLAQPKTNRMGAASAPLWNTSASVSAIQNAAEEFREYGKLMLGRVGCMQVYADCPSLSLGEAMNEVLSVSEIESKFPSEWVLIEDLQVNEAKEIQAGRVICHSKDREEVDQRAMELKPKWFAVLFAGSPPENLEFLL